MRRGPAIATAATVSSLPAALQAASRFPPPDFESGHLLPDTTVPSADAAWWGAVDTAVLFAALTAATWLVLYRRSRRGVIAVAVLSLVYFGFWRQGCVCAVGSMQNVALSLGDSTYALPLAAGAFFALPLVFALFFGRTFCSAVCPFGAIQELVILKPLQVPAWLDRPLGLLRHGYLALAVLFAFTGSAFIICRYDPFVGLFRRSATLSMVLAGAALLILGVFVARPYCRWLCPFSVLLGWLSRGSRRHARIDPEGCINCHLCAAACPVSAIDPGSDGQAVGGSLGDDVARPRRQLGRALLLVPAVVLVAAGLGWLASPKLAAVHPQIKLAERIALEDAGRVTGTTDASDAYRLTGLPTTDLYVDAEAIRSRFRTGAPIAFGFIGLAAALVLVQNEAGRRSRVYEIDHARCVSCASCFAACPHDSSHDRAQQTAADGGIAGVGPQSAVALTVAGQPPARRPGSPSSHGRAGRLAIGLASVAGVFSLVVAVMLLASHLGAQDASPVDHAELTTLRQQLESASGDVDLKTQIRNLDRDVRQTFFEQTRFVEKGAWLLLLGLACTLGAARHVTTLRRQQPKPLPPRAEERDRDQGRLAIVIVMLGIFGAGLPLALASRVELTPVPAQAAGSVSDSPVAAPEVPAAPATVRWPSFRGPEGAGVCTDAREHDYASTWNAKTGTNIRWSSPIELAGKGSPIVWGEHVFCTGADDKQRVIYCFDADTGAVQWSVDVAARSNTTEAAEVMDDTGYAASTPATDGRRVYAIFGNGQLAAVDMAGALTWTRDLGIPKNDFGHASSLAVDGNRVYVQFDQGRAEDGWSELICLDGSTGEILWRKARPVHASWASPIVVATADETQPRQLVTLSAPSAIGYEPVTGEERWRANIMDGDIAPSPIVAGGLVVAVVPHAALVALPVSGRGELDEINLAWRCEEATTDITSPVSDGRYVYVLATFGTLFAVDLTDGRLLWEHTLADASFNASPTLIGTRLYLTDTAGRTLVGLPTPDGFQLESDAPLGEPVYASIAPVGGRIYIRGESKLYCIEEPAP